MKEHKFIEDISIRWDEVFDRDGALFRHKNNGHLTVRHTLYAQFYGKCVRNEGNNKIHVQIHWSQNGFMST